MRAISRDPAERYTSAAEMRAELDRYLGSLPFVPAGDALQKYLHELVGLDASRKITDRALRMTFTDPAIVPPMPRSVSQQDLAPTTVRPDPTAFPIRDDEAAAPTIIAPDPTAGRPLRIATASFGPKPKPAWQRWLPTALGVPFVLLLAFGLRHWGGDPPARPPDPPAPVVHAAPPPKLAPVPQERPVLPERPIPPERPRPGPEHPRPTRLRVSEDASPKQVARQLAELGGSVGALKLTCEPACLLFVDGEAAGSSPPTKLVYLSAGRHLIKAVDLHSDRERTTGVTVRAGKALVRTVRF
jgi:serine/threonine-protein kinase